MNDDEPVNADMMREIANRQRKERSGLVYKKAIESIRRSAELGLYEIAVETGDYERELELLLCEQKFVVRQGECQNGFLMVSWYPPKEVHDDPFPSTPDSVTYRKIEEKCGVR